MKETVDWIQQEQPAKEIIMVIIRHAKISREENRIILLFVKNFLMIVCDGDGDGGVGLDRVTIRGCKGNCTDNDDKTLNSYAAVM